MHAVLDRQDFAAAHPALSPLRPDLSDMVRNSRRIAGILKSLAHPARLIIIRRLATGAASVKELIALLELSQSALSKQLARLREGELVEFDRVGRNVTYRLRDERIRGLISHLLHEISY